jgi:hypothetical protein
MNLEQTLHQHWSDSPALNALLHADRVTTGRSSLGSLPRATLARRSRRTVCRTNSGDSLEEVTVEMRLRHQSFDDGTAIVQQFLTTFDRSQFSLSDGAQVLNLRRIEDDCRQADDGTWQFRVEMLARIQLPAP